MRTGMISAPTILARPRYSPPSVEIRKRHTVSEQVSANIRYHLAMERLNTQFFATVAGIAIGRARHVYKGRRSATVAEVGALANALDIPISHFFREVL